ncbi:nuclear transport factor 2 family protein [Pseudonocardia ailaonensis]
MDEVIAKQEIRDLVLLYGMACDRDDAELLRQVYLPDGRDNRGEPNGLASEYIEAMSRLRAGSIMVAHQLTNHLIWVDGDVAEGEVRNVSHTVHTTDTGYAYRIMGGRYLDEYRRDGSGRWRIADRAAVVDWADGWPIDEAGARPRYGTTLSGADDETDPVYRVLSRARRGRAAW